MTRKLVRKGPQKSAKKSATGKPFTGADDPRRGRGPKKGAPNAGRPRKAHVEWCQTVISDPLVEAAALAVLRDSKHPLFANLWGKVADRAYGRAAGSDVTFPIDPSQLSDDQLQRIAQGEDPLAVLATSRAVAG